VHVGRVSFAECGRSSSLLLARNDAAPCGMAYLPGMNGLELYDLLHAGPGLEAIPAILVTATQFAYYTVRCD
jgi:hypothetical protein